MIDWSRVQELRREIGEEGFAEVVELFLDEVETVIGRLAAGSGNISAEDMHFLKGSALNLGFRELAALCQDGERHCNAGQGAAVDLAPLLRLYRESKAAFEAGLRRSTAA